MIFCDEPYEIVEQVLAFQLCQIVDMLHMMPNSENALPSSDRVGSDDGMLRRERGSHILGRTCKVSANNKRGKSIPLGPG